MSNFTAIPVTDGNGDELIVYVFRDRRGVKLCTGERVRKLDDETFEIPATGETLARVANS